MQPNVGSFDRLLRITVGAALVGFGIYHQSWWGALGLVPLLTALVRFCPAYTLLGLNTCRLGKG